MKKLTVLFLFLLTGCSLVFTHIDYSNPPPADWPQLKIEEHYADEATVKKMCALDKYAIILGCAHPEFDLGKCVIWYENGAGDWVKKHEHAHCRGYDHPGSTTMRDAWERYKDGLKEYENWQKLHPYQK